MTPQLTIDHDWLVLACPECNSHQVFAREIADPTHSHAGRNAEDPFACHARGCEWTGDQVIARPPTGPVPNKSGGLSGNALAADLETMSVEEFDQQKRTGGS